MSDSSNNTGGTTPDTSSLSWWLQRLEQMQPDRIELGLARIKQVAAACGLDRPGFDIITVAGTNGKGSTVAFIAGMLQRSGYRVGVYTSPHFIDFNERIVINGARADEQSLCEAFTFIDQHRADTDLTYFEFTTLAAVYCFMQAKVDIAVLEVGLGGRLDAVNAWDSQVACITSIGIDHVDWLGDDRESIGREKAGVARSGCPLICGDKTPPASIVETAASTGAVLLQAGVHFSARVGSEEWQYHGPHGQALLPMPRIAGDWAADNAAVAITACAEYLGRLPDISAVESTLSQVSIPGRMQQQRFSGVPVLLDVAHNQQAAELLGEYLRRDSQQGRRQTTAVFACMQDKDAGVIIKQLAATIDRWHVAQLDYPRAIDAQELVSLIESGKQAGGKHAGVEVFTSVIQAFESAVAQSTSQDRVVVFGSFHVVGPVLEFLASQE